MIDINSTAWRATAKYAEDRIAEYQTQIELDMPHDQTQRIRGAIAELRSLLEWATLKPTEQEETHYPS